MSTAARDVVVNIAQAPDGQEAEIKRVFEKQQAHALRLRASSAQERIARLKKLKAMVMDNTDAIHKACHADFRKSSTEVDLVEIMPIVIEVNEAIRKTKRWMKDIKVPTTFAMLGTQGRVRMEPKGVSLIIAPWNYPFNLTLSPLISALAAGCTAIMKPSEMTPNCSQLMDELIGQTFDEADVKVFQGEVKTSQDLLALPFDHIFFTGSPAVGKVVMTAAAKHLTSVTLELGGKSPAIFDKSANLKKHLGSLIWGKFANNGQTCIAPDLTYVHADIKDEFLAAAKSTLEEMYGQLDNIKDNPDYCRIVNSKHHGRIKSLLEDATSKGAKVYFGGVSDDAEDFLAPTLLTDMTPDSKIMQEEIFGPLMPVMFFNDVQEVIDDINSRPKPLALYTYASDNAFIEKVLNNTTAGGTCINTAMMQYLHGNLPFGGVNNSGIGSAHGYYGFKTFSHERAILRDRFSSSYLMMPPYTPFTQKLIDWTTKYFV